jgi:hypothetical protein
MKTKIDEVFPNNDNNIETFIGYESSSSLFGEFTN